MGEGARRPGARHFTAMIRYTTVQELIDGDYTLHANCINWHCQHNQTLDLVKLRDRLGPDLTISRRRS
jgi:hypothetical protein